MQETQINSQQLQNSIILEHLLQKSVINCVGTMSVLGGSRMDQRVLDAMTKASKQFVHMQDLNQRASMEIEKLAKLPQEYGCFISGGAASGLTLSVATCMIQNDLSFIQKLPSHSKHVKNIIIIDKNSDDRWLQCLEIPGGILQPIEMNENNLEETIIKNQKTVAAVTIFAGGYFTDRDSDFQKWILIAHKYQIPIICDAAAQLPPRSNLLKFVKLGFDFVLFSGGKAIGGPQSTGLIFAKRKYLQILGANASPNELTIGRPMKCDKESIIGLVTAFEIFVSKTDDEEMQQYDEINEHFQKYLMKNNQYPIGIEKIYRVCPGSPEIQPNIIPRLYIELQVEKLINSPKKKQNIEYQEIPIFEGHPNCLSKKIVYMLFIQYNPSIAINFHGDNELIFNPQTITIQESEYVADKLIEVLNKLL